jgi:flagella basal body P-ring formation protein FlgA
LFPASTFEKLRIAHHKPMLISQNYFLFALRLAMLLGCCGLVSSARSADQIVIGFVDTPRTSAHVVQLRDVVQIHAGQQAALERMLDLPLGPAPRDDHFQTWHADDVLQHLELRGFHRDRFRWSGATQTKLQKIAAPSNTASGSIEPAFVQGRTLELANSLVAQAISEYLNLRTGEQTDWKVRVSIPPKLADVIRMRRNIVGIGGGSEPWLGDQQFILQLKERDQLIQVPVAAQIELPPMVLVANRPLRREEILTEEALEFAPLPQRSSSDTSKYYTDPKQLIGQQLKRSVSTGLPISSDVVGSPTIIARNEMIEVESVSGGVSVRTMARSMGSGAVGELIDIEVIPTKQRMLATVVGPLKVRVAAVSARGGLTR